MTARRVPQHFRQLVAVLQETYPEAHCALNFTTPLELLIATILSAQCTDVRVNSVTPRLFHKYPAATDYVAAAPEELARDIQSTGFYRQKAQTIQRCCAALVRHYHGAVPDTMEALVQLPGVGRKTANVVLGNAFHRPEGIAVDTHVQRLVQRLGLSAARTPEKIEQALLAFVPRKTWTLFSHLLISHGRAICKARAPQCGICPIHHLCPSAPREGPG